MAVVTVYSTRLCGFCMRAKYLLNAKEVAFEEVLIDGDDAARQALVERTGARTVPQIFVGDEYVGGFSELSALESRGALDELLDRHGIPHGG